MASKSLAIRSKTRVIRVTRGKRKTSRKIPLAIVAGFAPLAINAINDFRFLGAQKAANNMMGNLTGYIPGQRWDANQMRNGTYPIIAGFIVHWAAGRFGVNRALGRLRLPFSI